MGACVSNHQKASPMKPQKSFDSTKKTDHKVVIHPSFGSEKFPTMNGHVAVKPQLPHSQSPATISDFGMTSISVIEIVHLLNPFNFSCFRSYIRFTADMTLGFNRLIHVGFEF